MNRARNISLKGIAATILGAAATIFVVSALAWVVSHALYVLGIRHEDTPIWLIFPDAAFPILVLWGLEHLSTAISEKKD